VVISCIKCHKESRLDEEFLREATKGMQVCCRDCGCSFDVQIISLSFQDNEATKQIIFRFATNSAT